ncbi:MAG: LpxI family protein [Planctomycetota bacterium]|nr:MAG: LpxI family protein [Planctomycetota bacterium]
MDASESASLTSLTAPPDPIGIVAGWGSFPLEVARDLRDTGHRVIIAALRDHADPALQQYASDMQWFGVLKLGRQIRYFQRHGVRSVILAGKVFKHRILYHGMGWMGHMPDWTCVQAFREHFISRTKDGRDDSLLTAIVAAFENKNMRVVPITQCGPRLLAETGCLTHRRPSSAQMRDIAFGWQIARQMGRLDIGQSITVKDQMVLGVEAIEGTDALIDRTGQLCPRGRFTLVKVAKPQQDMRFDVPTIGVRTVEQMRRAGGTVIAIEAGRTIFVEREETLRLAQRAGIAIVALRQAGMHLLCDRWSLPLAGPQDHAAESTSTASHPAPPIAPSADAASGQPLRDRHQRAA